MEYFFGGGSRASLGEADPCDRMGSADCDCGEQTATQDQESRRGEATPSRERRRRGGAVYEILRFTNSLGLDPELFTSSVSVRSTRVDLDARFPNAFRGLQTINAYVLKKAEEYGFVEVRGLCSDTTAQEAKIPYPNEVGLMNTLAKSAQGAFSQLGRRIGEVKK